MHWSALGEAAPVAATLAAPAAGRRAWSAELMAPAALGSVTITATADTPEAGPVTASVAVKIVGVKASGRWEGEINVYDGTPANERVTGGSFVVLYNIEWFRIFFGAIEVNGTTDNWDLIDKGGFRITGTYHAAGETNERGEVMPSAWVDYRAVMDDGKIIEGVGTEED